MLEVAAIGCPTTRSGVVRVRFVVKKDPALTADAAGGLPRSHRLQSRSRRRVPRANCPRGNVGKILPTARNCVRPRRAERPSRQWSGGRPGAPSSASVCALRVLGAEARRPAPNRAVSSQAGRHFLESGSGGSSEAARPCFARSNSAPPDRPTWRRPTCAKHRETARVSQRLVNHPVQPLADRRSRCAPPAYMTPTNSCPDVRPAALTARRNLGATWGFHATHPRTAASMAAAPVRVRCGALGAVLPIPYRA